MATNPMKRREHTALIIGFAIGLALAIVVGAIGYKKYKDKADELTAFKAKIIPVVVASDDIESGTSLKPEQFTIADVITTMDTEDTFSNVNDVLGAMLVDEEAEDEDEEDEKEAEYENAAKIAIPAGTIITKSMLVSVEDALTNDKRLQEYSSIALPSELKNGDFVDIRFALPTGQDYIVLSKKEVVQTNETTMWINVNEAELLLLNSAMVEAWTITGTKLYAIEYIDAGMQDAAQITYKPSAEVTDLIMSDPNITKEAYDGLTNDLTKVKNDKSMQDFRGYIDSALQTYVEDRDDSVDEGYTNEITSMQEHRADYVEALNGTGDVGSKDMPAASSSVTE